MMQGILFACKGVHSGREIIFGYPHTIYKEHCTYFDSVHFNSSLSAISSEDRNKSVLGFPCSVLADLLCPKRELWDIVMDISIESIRFIGYPISLGSKLKKKSRILRSKSLRLIEQDIKETKEQISAFNVIMVFDMDSPLLAYHQGIRDAIIRFNTTLKFEHQRTNFLSTEISKLKSISSTTDDEESFVLSALQESLLAKHLQEIYSSVSSNRECRLFINNWLVCNLQISPEYNIPEIKPYHSLLLLDFYDKIQEQLGPFTSSILSLMVKHFRNPIKSFEDINNELEIPYSSLFPAAQHLVFWKKAKIIPALGLNSIIAVGPNWKYTQVLNGEFDRVFQGKVGSFADLLNKLQSPIMLRDLEVNKIKGKKLITVLTWLLRKNIIEDYHYFLYLFPKNLPKETKKYYSLNEPIPRDLLSQFLAQNNDNSEQYSIFSKVAPYGTGKFIIEEVSWKEKISQEAIISCVNNYSNLIRAVMHA
ncbi:NPRL3 [Blepharisma stoltei]|uniref:Uncharacterized protein n=1 Tax=Blepharisma stoltei TaxID=1481888 RepID=A0AAU9JXE6_9CILI|nr:unnamed protein product [Blepharisma stoltei]